MSLADKVAIGAGIAGVIGAITGVIALWFTYQDRRAERAKIYISIEATYGPPKGSLKSSTIRVVNKGQKAVIIESVWLTWGGKWKVRVEDSIKKGNQLIDGRSPVVTYDVENAAPRPDLINEVEIVTATGKRYRQKTDYTPPPNGLREMIGVVQKIGKAPTS